MVNNNLAFRRTSTSGRHFLLNFPFQRSSLSMKLSFVSQIARRKVVFCDSSSKPFDVFAACFERTNEVFQSL